MKQKRIAIIEAPSNLGLKPPVPDQLPGVFQQPEALKAAGLHTQLDAVEAGRIEPAAYSFALDAQVGVRNADGIRDFSLQLAPLIAEVISRNDFPLVLGGDCSILLGSMLALRRMGNYGLLFIDGHTDFGTPQTSQTGGAAGMDLALVCGRGLESLTNLDGLRPLVQEEHVVLIGNRDVENEESYIWREVFDTDIHHYSLDTIREMGIATAAEQAVAYLKGMELAGVWLHLDVDVLDDAIMPAVDSRQPGGMSFAELSQLLNIVLSSGLAVGMEVTIFDPTLDRDGSIAQSLVAALVAGFVI